MAALAQARDGRRHVVDVLGGRRQPLGPFEAQRCAIVEKRLNIGGRVVLDGLPLRRGVADDLIVHVRDVHDVVQPETVGAKGLAQDVHEREGSEIADMREVVHGGTARVHADGVVVRGSELLHLLRERIVESQRHKVGKFHRTRL